ncbi:MAG: Caspase protein [Blastococcus sp.]|jgi:hypothetical protein|nr:Caspase protein [Blastococcus sp.]
MPVRLVLTLLALGGVLQLLSRVLVFDASSGNRADDSGFAAPPWVLAVALPLVVAALLLGAVAREQWAAALAGGLVTGAALSQLDQVLATLGRLVQTDASVAAGPGWWAAVFGTLALLAAVVVLLRAPLFHARPGLRRSWPAAAMTVVVLGAAVTKIVTFRFAYPWFAQNEPAIVLALACVPLTLLALDPAQRLLGVTAVTIFGSWVCAAHLYALANEDFSVDASAARLAIASALASVAACYLAQLSLRRPLGMSAPERGWRR